MKKPERLLQLITLLRGRRTSITAQQLAEKLDVSERTVYRDIQSLIATGVEVDGEAGIGYRLCPGDALPPLMFNESEIEALMLGIRLVKSWTDDQLCDSADKALQKIRATLPDKLLHDLNHRNTKFIVPDYMKKEKAKYADVIRKAIAAQRTLKLDYETEDKIASTRTVQPLGMIFWGAAWTLAAWCELRDDYRLFRLDRIKQCELSDTTFDITEEKSLKKYLQQYSPNVKTGFWDD
ncbi:MAG: YafY family transcriptional regulator [Agarilytica sp.]